MMKTAYGINWLKVNFIGIDPICDSLRDIARYFGDEKLMQRTEEVIAEEKAAIADDMAFFKTRLDGKTAALFVGGSRSHHYQSPLRDLGVSTVLAGYEFAHRDDYEGRDVIPEIKEDADSKNIEELHVEKDEKRYRAFLNAERYEELKRTIGLEDYKGMIHDMPDGSYVVDDLNHFETEAFTKLLNPDIFFSGVKDKYVLQKGGTLSRQLHSYDYSGPYAGFKGAVIFGRDLVMGLYAPAWNMVTPPWKPARAAAGGTTNA
jgi:nitrogenase molybdenum-iron protein alpha chain